MRPTPSKLRAMAAACGLALAAAPLAWPGPRLPAARAQSGTENTAPPSTYWLVGSDGSVTAFGSAANDGSLAGKKLNQPIVGMAGLPTAPGYWLVARDGGIFTFGKAGYYGSTGAMKLNQPIVGMAATPDGAGYWLVASDGGIFTFGDATFHGSTGAIRLNKPIVGMAPTPDSGGYWLAASDGGIFNFGDAKFYGSMGGTTLASPVVSIAAPTEGGGYWLAAADGGVFNFGDAKYHGSLGGKTLPAPIVAIATANSLDPYTPGTTGYDISWPQCNQTYPPSPYSVAVVGVNNGEAFTQNPCLTSEAAWGAPAGLTLYINLNSPTPSTSSQGLTGPAGQCVTTDSTCQAYNYGYNAAVYSYDYASGLGIKSSMWWLDIETGGQNPLWSTDTAANSQLIAGAIAALTALGVQPGVYSTAYQWGQITGGTYSPDVPMWQTGATTVADAPSFCSPTKAFTSGQTWLVQYAPTTWDGDYAC